MESPEAARDLRIRPVLFHRRSEPDSTAARELILSMGLRETLEFEEVSNGSDLLRQRGGNITPALWDGERLHEGLAAIVQRLVREEGESNAAEQRSEPPDAYSFGEEINWNAPWLPVTYSVELPFWLAVADSRLVIPIQGHDFPVEIHGDYLGAPRESRVVLA